MKIEKMNTTAKADLINSLNLQLQRYEKNLNGHQHRSVKQMRLKAFDVLKKSGFPKAKNEEYKYTNVTRQLFDDMDCQIPGKPVYDTSGFDANQLFKDVEAYHIIIFNGMFIPEISTLPPPSSPLWISDLNVSSAEYQTEFYNNFGHLARPEQDPFIALNASFVGHGIYIHIPENLKVRLPIIVHHYYNSEIAARTINPRSLYIVKDGAQADIIEAYYHSGGQELFINSVNETITGQNTQFNLYKIQQIAPKASLVDNTRIDQKKDGVTNVHTYTLGGALVRNNLHVALTEEHCETHMFGLYVLKNDSHVDNHTVADHIMPKSYSNEIYKGILDDQSTGVFNGKIYVRPNAQKTNAFQSNKNILLSEAAKINTKPQLEIWADDVKCSHGCTTGQIDEEQLFYLRSRGISERSARVLLLHAFTEDVLSQIGIEPLRSHLDRTIMERLH